LIAAFLPRAVAFSAPAGGAQTASPRRPFAHFQRLRSGPDRPYTDYKKLKLYKGARQGTFGPRGGGHPSKPPARACHPAAPGTWGRGCAPSPTANAHLARDPPAT
jgi:hypothetical protein